MVRLKRIYLAIFLLVISFLISPAHSSDLTLRTEKIFLEASFPKDFCLLNKEYSRDAFLMEYLQTISGKSMKLMGVALPCAELEIYRHENSHLPSHSLSLFQVGVDGHFTRFLLGKKIFNKLITSFSLDENIERIQKRTDKKIAQFDDYLVMMQAQLIDQNSNGVVLMEGKAQIAHKTQDPKTFDVKAATTLVHKYPFVAVEIISDEKNSEQKVDESRVIELLKSIRRR